ncbi:hypothetical protein V500_05838 [Pseudogymnoascus sp. VKM F-4518 (FW-2643)]|nr:hypothetical protein V500_05838 [Pseudogymnoascus sp. VKM F-4518 (FW-2643)]
MAANTTARPELPNPMVPGTASIQAPFPAEPCAESVSSHLPCLPNNTKTECDIKTPLQPYHDFLESRVTPFPDDKPKCTFSSVQSAPLSDGFLVASATPIVDTGDSGLTHKSPAATTLVYPTYAPRTSHIRPRLRLRIPPFPAFSDNDVGSPERASPTSMRSTRPPSTTCSICSCDHTELKGRWIKVKTPKPSHEGERHMREIFTCNVIPPNTRRGGIHHVLETVTHTITDTLPNSPGGVRQVREVITRTVIFMEPLRPAPKMERRRVK